MTPTLASARAQYTTACVVWVALSATAADARIRHALLVDALNARYPAGWPPLSAPVMAPFRHASARLQTATQALGAAATQLLAAEAALVAALPRPLVL